MNPTRQRWHWKKAVLGKDLPRLEALLAEGAQMEWRLNNQFGTHGKMTALQLACLLDWAQGACWLIDQGASVDVFTRCFATPLSFAVKGGECVVVRSILKKSLHTLSVVSVWDEAPLHIAAYSGDASMVELLLSFGASPLLPNSEGKTPLDSAEDAAALGCLALMHAHLARGQYATLDQSIPIPLLQGLPVRI